MDKNKTTHPEHQTVLLSWDAPEFMPAPRGKLWYLTAFALAGLLMAYALISGNLTMAFFLILLGASFILTEKKPPRDVPVHITDLGVSVGRNFYPYHHINAFWLVYHPPYVRALYLRLKEGRTYRCLKIELSHQKPQPVRQALLKEIPEIEGAMEPITDTLTRLLRLQ